VLATVVATAMTLVVLVTASAAAAAAISLQATDATVGGQIGVTAHLSEAPAASGEISFQVFGPDDPACTTALLPAPASAVVAGEGDYASGTFTADAAGAYHWSAQYSGDLVNPPAESPCSAISQVAKASPTLTVGASNATVGRVIHAEATLGGDFEAGGEVTFSLFATSACASPVSTATVPIQNGTAVAPDYRTEAAGSYRWSASYPGDANNEAVSSACSAESAVAAATPTLAGLASSAARVGLPITDTVPLSHGFRAGGTLVFRAYGPEDKACAGTPAFEQQVAVNGDGSYSPAGFAPGAGLYRWTVAYGGDPNNGGANLPCNTDNQSSAVGLVPVTLTASAAGGIVGSPLGVTARLAEGAIPGGQLTFRAFPPGDPGCSGAAALTSVVPVSGNGSYASAPLPTTRAGAYRWTVSYGGDRNHLPAALACGVATSNALPTMPTISGQVKRRPTVGSAFRDTATLTGAYAPSGKVTFRIYGPGSKGCATPAYTDTVAVGGNGAISSDPFVAKLPGRYVFVAGYSGDTSNGAAAEPCGSPAQTAIVGKRQPRVKPRAAVSGRRISIAARLSAGASPTGVVSFRLYGPGDRLCKKTPAFRGGVSVKSNGTYSLAEYLANRPGIYRLAVSYSGDRSNARVSGGCGSAQTIRVGKT
jgi:hypothetical protein